MTRDYDTALKAHIKRLRHEEREMWPFLMALYGLDGGRDKMALGRWAYEFKRFGVYNALGHRNLAEYLRSKLAITRDDPLYVKARNAWASAIRSYQKAEARRSARRPRKSSSQEAPDTQMMAEMAKAIFKLPGYRVKTPAVRDSTRGPAS
jgi:hypothetical protein